MIPIRELLDRIRWDENFRRARFALGYYDRVDKTLHIVRLEDLAFPPGDRRFFELISSEGKVHRIPLHRIRAVYRNGGLIWHRDY